MYMNDAVSSVKSTGAHSDHILSDGADSAEFTFYAMVADMSSEEISVFLSGNEKRKKTSLVQNALDMLCHIDDADKTIFIKYVETWAQDHGMCEVAICDRCGNRKL
jgi:hypothetical protein